jgi:CCR4-NOT transcriptional regulation complex NOT5 subunit
MLLQLEEVVAVHKKHTSALEKALRCLDNDAITSEEIDPLKDDLDYYIVSGLCQGFGTEIRFRHRVNSSGT